MKRGNGEESTIQIERYMAAFFATTLLFVLYCVWFHKISVENERVIVLGESNLDVVLYLIGLVGYIGSFFCCVLFLKGEKLLNGCIKVVSVVAPMSILIWLGAHYLLEEKEFASQASNLLRHNAVFSGFFLLLTFLVCIVLSSIKIIFIPKYERKTRLAVGILCILVEFLVLFHPNILGDNLGKSMHQTAYITTIISAVNFQPWSSINYSIYGHYGLFYIIPVRILQALGINQWFAIIACIALFGAVYMGCVVYIAHKLIKNSSAFLLTILFALLPSVTVYGTGVYYQLHPHRMLFPAIVAAILVFFETGGGTFHTYIKKGVLHIVLILSLLWNLETGAVCCSAVLGHSFLKRFGRDGIVKNCLLSAADLSFFILDFLAAYILTNIYNGLAGGSWNTVLEFIYPFLSKEYVINNLRMPIGDISNIWFIETLVFAGTISLGTFLYLNGKMKEDRSFSNVFFLAVIGAGLMVDYINRSAALNATLPYAYFAVIVGYFYDQILLGRFSCQGLTDTFFKRAFILLRSILLFLSFACVIYMGVTFQRRSENGWNTEKMEELADLIKEEVPEGTMALGGEAPAIYAMLGWEPRLYTVDIGDMKLDPEAESALFDKAKEVGVILLDYYFGVYHPNWESELEEFELIKEIGEYALYGIK